MSSLFAVFQLPPLRDSPQLKVGSGLKASGLLSVSGLNLFLVSAVLLNSVYGIFSLPSMPAKEYLLNASCVLDPKLGSGGKEERHRPGSKRA